MPPRAATIVDDTTFDDCDVTVPLSLAERQRTAILDLAPEEQVKARRTLRRRRSAAKLAGYRTIAKKAGSATGFGTDLVTPVLTRNETKRLLRSMPKSFKEPTFGLEEGMNRIENGFASIGKKALSIARNRLECVLRDVVRESVANMVDAGKSRVDAAMMASVLRKYGTINFTTTQPSVGAMDAASQAGLVDDAEPQDAAVAKALHKFYKQKLAETEDAKKAKKAKKTKKAKKDGEDGGDGEDGEDGEGGEGGA